MSVEIGTSALSMSESLNSLETTPSPMHRVYMEVGTLAVWYKIIREANVLYGRNWRGQSGVKRRLSHNIWSYDNKQERVWFDVPDEKFGTWVAIKCGVRVVAAPGK
jgi:hypothetical protein